MRKVLIILAITISLNIAYAQNVLLPHSAQEVMQFINDPQNKNDKLNNIQIQNDTELVMFIMKSIEDKNIQDIDKKIEFINSLNVGKTIKDQVITLVNQDITYSDNEKISYGGYMLKKCNKTKAVGAIIDYRPMRGCVYERSNIC